MTYSDLFYIVRVFDDELEDFNEYRFEREDSAIEWFRYCYNLNKVVSLRKVQIGCPEFTSFEFKPHFLNTPGMLYQNEKENEK